MRVQLGTSPVVVLGLAAVYVLAGKLGLLLAFVHASATAVWPPTGIALAAFLLLGYRVWPGIFLGAFLLHFTTVGGPSPPRSASRWGTPSKGSPARTW